MNENQNLNWSPYSDINGKSDHKIYYESNNSKKLENSLDVNEEKESTTMLKKLQHFEPLKPAEQTLLHQLNNGKNEISYSHHSDNKPPDVAAKTASQEDKRTLRAELLACICRDLEIQKQFSSQGLTIKGAIIEGELNLKFAEIDIPLNFLDCAFTADLLLEQAKLRRITLKGSHVTSIQANQINVEGSIELNEGFCAKGKVSLPGATIGGTFDCSGGKFINPEGIALVADGIQTGNSVFLKNNFCAKGTVSLIGATIGGTFNCSGGKFINPEGIALVADGIEVKRDVFLTTFNPVSFIAKGEAVSFIAKGTVSLIGATIGGTLDCKNGTFESSKGIALLAVRTNIKGDIFLRNGFSANGEVNLNRATIGGDLNCSGGKFISKDNRKESLSVEGATIAQSILLNNYSLRNGEKICFSADGEVNLSRVTVGGDLDLRGSKKVPLNLEFAKIQNLKLGEKDSWVEQDQLHLNGLVYDSISVETNDSDQQSNEKSDGFKTCSQKETPLELDWIRKQPHKPFLPQPYGQLATVLKSHGKEGEAIQVLIGKEDDRRKYDGLSWLGKRWNQFLGLTIGHGYQPERAVWAALGLLVIGGGIFMVGDSRELMSPATDSFISKASISQVCPPESSSDQRKEIDECPNYPKFNPFFYSLDILLPVVDLHLESYWLPNTSWLRYYLWFQILMGWILTSLMVAGFSGLVRSSN